MPEEAQSPTGGAVRQLDAAIIGAGFGGLYALHLLRGAGLTVRVYDDASEVGGTWAWNRYPGARVDFPAAPTTATPSRRRW